MTWLDVNNACIEVIHFLQDVIQWIIKFLTDSTLYNDLYNTVTGNVIISIIKSTAITLCVLFFLIDFFQKTMHLSWVTWENVLLFFMKLFIAKIAVENAGGVLSIIQNGFDSILNSSIQALAPNSSDPADTFGLLFSQSLFPRIQSGVPDANTNAAYVSYFFSSSDSHFEEICQGSESISVAAMFYNIQLFIIGLILKIVFIMCAIIVIARVFELLVYTAIAPIPLATLSCEGLQDVGKGFLKSFAGVCLQSVVIIIMMIVYSTMLSSSAFDFSAISNQWRGQVKLLLFTFIFGAGVMQSGSWAKKICGAM